MWVSFIQSGESLDRAKDGRSLSLLCKLCDNAYIMTFNVFAITVTIEYNFIAILKYDIHIHIYVYVYKILG